LTVEYAATGGNRYVVINKTIPELHLAVAVKGNRKGSTAATISTGKQRSTGVLNGKRPQTNGGGGDEVMAQREEGSKRYEGDTRGD
jgi:hypothetical protein